MVERPETLETVPRALPSMRRGRRRLLIRAMLVVSDAVMLLGASLGATYIRFEHMNPMEGFEHTFDRIPYYELSIWLTCVWLVCMVWEGLYDLDRVFWGSGEFSRLARALALGVVGFILITFVLKEPGLSRLWTVIATALALVFTVSGRLGVRALLGWLRRHDRLLRATLIVGTNTEAQDLLRVLSADRSTGIRPVGCLASSRAERLSLDFCGTVPCLGASRDVVSITREYGIDTVVIASSAFDHDVLARIVAELRDRDVDVHISSGLFEVLTSRMLVREMSGVPLITVKGVSLSKTNVATKRAFDLAISLAIVVVGMPVWLLLAAAIKAESRGSVFYGQERVGKDGVPFRMLKFRSMVSDADARLRDLADANEADGPLFKMRDDPRITAVGRWMRKFSLDEFPQVINVLKGEMSLVGPRPPLPHEVDRYTSNDWRRLGVVPGMTGLWQVSGRSTLTFDEMVRLDLFYIENWSVRLDLALLARTLPAVLATKGAF